jgi:subtilisin family serine protease
MTMTQKITVLGITALALAACAPSAPPGPLTRDSTTVVDPGELVGLAAGPHAADRLEAEAARQGIAVESREPLPSLDLILLTLRIPETADVRATIRSLEAAAPGTVVGRNHAYRPGPEADAATDARLYADALLSWPVEGCPAAVPIGIVDTPLDAAAAGLDGVALTTRDFTGGAPADLHGAAVAEILAGPGRLYGARLYHAAVVGDASGAAAAAGVDDIVKAVDWLSGEGVRLVNVSLAGPYNKILDRGLRAAAARGVVLVAAAGNDGDDAPPRYPAGFPFVIAVTAVDAELDPYRRAPRGDHIDFAAPGVDVYVPLGGGGRYLSGTSIATPFVTALAATQAPDGHLGSATAVRTRLAQTAVDIGASGPDDTFGTGLATAAAGCRRAT